MEDRREVQRVIALLSYAGSPTLRTGTRADLTQVKRPPVMQGFHGRLGRHPQGGRPRVPGSRSGSGRRRAASSRKRGYHGARVQGIARGAACNVALIYRHWASKRALYLDILRAVWLGSANEIARLVRAGAGRAGARSSAPTSTR